MNSQAPGPKPEPEAESGEVNPGGADAVVPFEDTDEEKRKGDLVSIGILREASGKLREHHVADDELSCRPALVERLRSLPRADRIFQAEVDQNVRVERRDHFRRLGRAFFPVSSS